MKINHISITAKNIEESKNFYKTFFGFSELRSFERPDLNGKAVFMQCENIMIEIWEFSDSLPFQDGGIKTLGLTHIAFEMEDIESFIKTLPGDLIKSDITVGASGGKYVFLKDPSGIDIELYQPNWDWLNNSK